MADITDPQYLRFVNERLRPMAEKVRNLDLELVSLIDDYNDVILPLATANAGTDPVADGREAEGISRLTKMNVVQAIAVFAAIRTAIDADATQRSKVNICAVRPPTVS